jgi:hypothetical protein
MKKFAIAFLPVLALLAFVAFYQPATTEAQANIPCYRAQGGATNVAGSGCTYDFKSGSTLKVQSGATMTTTDIYVAQQGAQTITYGGTITPTGMYHQITAAAARGTSSVAGVATAGRVVVLINIGSNTITLTDTGTLKLSGNIALGQYDSVSLLSDGTNWIQLATSNN